MSLHKFSIMIRLGVSGVKGSGKDYFGSVVSAGLDSREYRLSFAQPVHDICRVLDSNYDKRTERGRRLAQLIGTEVGRGEVHINIDQQVGLLEEIRSLKTQVLAQAARQIPYLSLVEFNDMLGTKDLWINLFKARYRAILSQVVGSELKANTYITCCDVRFENEFRMLKELGFTLAYVAAPIEQIMGVTQREQSAFTNSHVSESINGRLYEELVTNGKKSAEAEKAVGLEGVGFDLLIWNDRYGHAEVPSDQFLLLEKGKEYVNAHNY